MRRVVLSTLLALIASAAVAQAAHGALVTNMRLSGTPSWEQWIERDTVRFTGFGWVQTACSPREPTLSFTLQRTSEPESEGTFFNFIYLGVYVPLDLRSKYQATSWLRPTGFGPVSQPLHEAMRRPDGQYPGSTQISQVGRGLLVVGLLVGQPTDLLNVRQTTYRGVSVAEGACAAAGLDLYAASAPAPAS